MAVQNNFIQGRKTQHVVASCLYVVCRREKRPHMLIDFADSLNTNLFVLGSTVLKLLRVLNINLPFVDPSLYIHRFANQLELGDKAHAVAMTALRLLAHMRRDWLQVGRRPSGLCGACLIISARMHNFKRSLQEVANVVRIGDLTLKKRIDELGRTNVADMTSDEFELLDAELVAQSEAQFDPPAFVRGQELDAKRRAVLNLLTVKPELVSALSVSGQGFSLNSTTGGASSRSQSPALGPSSSSSSSSSSSVNGSDTPLSTASSPSLGLSSSSSSSSSLPIEAVDEILRQISSVLNSAPELEEIFSELDAGSKTGAPALLLPSPIASEQEEAGMGTSSASSSSSSSSTPDKDKDGFTQPAPRQSRKTALTSEHDGSNAAAAVGDAEKQKGKGRRKSKRDGTGGEKEDGEAQEGGSAEGKGGAATAEAGVSSGEAAATAADADAAMTAAQARQVKALQVVLGTDLVDESVLALVRQELTAGSGLVTTVSSEQREQELTAEKTRQLRIVETDLEGYAQELEVNGFDDLDDDEVNAIILKPDEKALKERVWLKVNESYLNMMEERRKIEAEQAALGIAVKRKSRPRDKNGEPGRPGVGGASAAERKVNEKINYAQWDRIEALDNAVVQHLTPQSMKANSIPSNTPMATAMLAPLSSSSSSTSLLGLPGPMAPRPGASSALSSSSSAIMSAAAAASAGVGSPQTKMMMSGRVGPTPAPMTTFSMPPSASPFASVGSATVTTTDASHLHPPPLPGGGLGIPASAAFAVPATGAGPSMTPHSSATAGVLDPSGNPLTPMLSLVSSPRVRAMTQLRTSMQVAAHSGAMDKDKAGAGAGAGGITRIKRGATPAMGALNTPSMTASATTTPLMSAASTPVSAPQQPNAAIAASTTASSSSSSSASSLSATAASSSGPSTTTSASRPVPMETLSLGGAVHAPTAPTLSQLSMPSLSQLTQAMESAPAPAPVPVPTAPAAPSVPAAASATAAADEDDDLAMIGGPRTTSKAKIMPAPQAKRRR